MELTIVTGAPEVSMPPPPVEALEIVFERNTQL